MQDIPFHIAFLLTQYECVVVPGLGTFIVTSTDKEMINRWGFFSPPEKTIVYDPEIKHDDGLLVSSIVKKEKIPFAEANLFLNRFVTSALHSLNQGEEVLIPGVGTLYLKDNKRLFRADKTLSCNAIYFGLNRFNLPYLKDIPKPVNIIQPSIIIPEKEEAVLVRVRRKSLFYVGFIALVITVLFIIPIPLNNGRFSPAIKQPNSIIPLLTPDTISSITQTDNETSQSEPIGVVKVTALHYYIIIASYQDQSSAMVNLYKVKSKGFENADIINSNEKYHIYINHFEDKVKAAETLFQFKNDFPEYSSAWLHSSLPPHQSEQNLPNRVKR